MGATALIPGSESSDQPNRVVLVFLTFNVGVGALRAMVMAAENWRGSPMVWFARPRSSKCSGFVLCRC